jgi:Spy/CpxP family protein refolding chaperone
MTKVIALIAVGSFAATALFAGEHGVGLQNVQNEKKEMKMACSIPLGDLNLTPEQMKKMNAVMAEHMKAGCTEASEAKYIEEAKAVMTPEQYTKFREKYDRAPKEKMGG